MIAVDTNIVVRFIIGDDARQFEQAVQLFRRETIFVAKSVLLETEWVLRRGYRQKPATVNDVLGALIDLSNVTCEDDANVRQALAWHHGGMDFADALHFAASSRATRFVTFDRDMLQVGRKLKLIVSEP